MFKNILIIGFGMIGSSIAQSAKKSNKAIKISLKGMKFCYELSFEFNIL